MHLSVLGSGSNGNSMVLQSNGVNILIDAGLTAKQITIRLNSIGLQVSQLDAVLLTHEHCDHTKGIRVLLKRPEIPVYTNALTHESIEATLPDIKWRIFQNNHIFQIGELQVMPFPVPHDAQSPVGYTIRNQNLKLGIITDLGHATDRIRAELQDLDGLFIESNYDEELLELDQKRPWSIKQRIASKHGHLSNRQAAELVGEIATEKLKCLILGHLSLDCNTEAHAMETMTKYLKFLPSPFKGNITCANQNTPTKCINLSPHKIIKIGV